MTAKERFCPVCGESMGVLDYVDRFDTCGAVACEREMRIDRDEARYRAHEELDRDLGY